VDFPRQFSEGPIGFTSCEEPGSQEAQETDVLIGSFYPPFFFFFFFFFGLVSGRLRRKCKSAGLRNLENARLPLVWCALPSAFDGEGSFFQSQGVIAPRRKTADSA
jgi:hypothetical protein